MSPSKITLRETPYEMEAKQLGARKYSWMFRPNMFMRNARKIRLPIATAIDTSMNSSKGEISDKYVYPINLDKKLKNNKNKMHLKLSKL